MTVDGVTISLKDLQDAWEKPLSHVFPIKSESGTGDAELPLFTTYGPRRSEAFGTPRVFIPVCPGTNCEYDSAAAFERAGATTDVMVLRNNTPQDLAESIDEMAKRIAKARSSCSLAASVPVTNRKVQASLLPPCSATRSCRKPWKTCSISAMAWLSVSATASRP